MYHVYIIKSLVSGKHYIGSTSNLGSRIIKHNSGGNRSTKSGRPWQLVHTEMFANKSDAWFRERQIKSYKGGEAFKKLVK